MGPYLLLIHQSATKNMHDVLETLVERGKYFCFRMSMSKIVYACYLTYLYYMHDIAIKYDDLSLIVKIIIKTSILTRQRRVNVGVHNALHVREPFRGLECSVDDWTSLVPIIFQSTHYTIYLGRFVQNYIESAKLLQ